MVAVVVVLALFAAGLTFLFPDLQAQLTAIAALSTIKATSTTSATIVPVHVGVVPAPTVSIFATPTTITKGESTKVAWASTNASSCVGSNALSLVSSSATSSSMTETPTIIGTSTYTITCTGSGGTSIPVSVGVIVKGSTPTSAPSSTSTSTSTLTLMEAAIKNATTVENLVVTAQKLGFTTMAGTNSGGVRYVVIEQPSTNKTIGLFAGPQY